MTKKEAAVITAYTGILIGSFSDFHGYAEKLVNHPIFTHQFGSKKMAKKIKQLSKQDFMELNKNVN